MITLEELITMNKEEVAYLSTLVALLMAKTNTECITFTMGDVQYLNKRVMLSEGDGTLSLRLVDEHHT